MKWKILVLTILELVSVVSQFVSSDQIIIGDIELVSYSNPLNKTNETQYSDKKIIYFQNKRFENVPKIIIGYSCLDYDYNTINKSFEIQYDNVTRDSFQMQFIKYQDTKVYKIVAVYAVIDSNDVFWDQVTLSFENWPKNNLVFINKPFSRSNIDMTKFQRKAVGFFTSLKSDGKKLVQRHKVQVKVEVGTSSIDISALQDDPDRSLIEIKVNYFEYYVEAFDSYYDINIISDTKYADNILRQANYYQTTIKLDYTNKGDLKGIISAINMLDIPINQYSGRIEITNNTYNNAIQEYYYNYRIWYDTQIYSFSATSIAFKMKDCSKNLKTPINNSFTRQCVYNCPEGYIITAYAGIDFSQCLMNPCKVNDCQLCDSKGVCIKCNPNFYIYKNQCWPKPPPRTYCDDTEMICNDCQSKQCQTCKNLNTCLSCIDFYLFNGECIQTKPKGTYCDRDKICKRCKDNNCTNCDENLECISCAKSEYFHENKCLKQKPNQAYCDDQNNICFTCDAICKQCIGTKNTDCTECNTNYNKLNNNRCECMAQNYGFDPTQQKCQPCSISQCKNCYGNYKECLACSADSVLVNGKCECKNQNQYFDSFYQNCLTTTIENCKIAKKTSNECEQCKEGFFQDTSSGKCLVCSNSMYADSLNRCIFKCRPNCLICVNDISCIQEIPIDTNTNNKTDNQTNEETENCHFSCSKCSESKNAKSCLLCSSDTRTHDSKTNECPCNTGYSEIEQQNCQKIADLDQGMAKTFKVVSYISLGIQSIFIFGLNSPDFQYLIILQQYLYLMTFYPSFDSNLNFNSYLAIFRHFSIFSFFESVKIFSSISNFLNTLIIYTSILVVTILIGFLLHFFDFQFAYAIYFRWNLIFLVQRLMSLFSFVILFKLILRDQLYSHSFTISVISCFILFYLIGIGLHIKGIQSEIISLNKQNQLSNTIDNSQMIKQNLYLKNQVENSMEKPILNPNNKNQIQNLEIETISNFKQRISETNKKQKQYFISPFQVLFSQLNTEVALSKYFWLFVECRKIITGFLIGFLGDKVWPYYVLPSISFIFVIYMSFSKIQIDQKKRKLVLLIECMIICIQVFTSFYFNQLNDESNDQNQILIFIISCSIFIIAISLIVFQLAVIIEYLKAKFDYGDTQQQEQQQKQEQNKSKNNMRMQSYFTKDQINAVLDPTVYNSNKNPRNKRPYNY